MFCHCVVDGANSQGSTVLRSPSIFMSIRDSRDDVRIILGSG